MERNKFNSIIIEYFNEIEDKYLADIKNDWDGEEIGSTILIEDYLLPFIYDNLENDIVMNKLGLMLEEILMLNDDYCEEVLYSSFFEKIHYDHLENKFINFFKDKTREFYKSLKF